MLNYLGDLFLLLQLPAPAAYLLRLRTSGRAGMPPGVLAFVGCVALLATALDNGLGTTPPLAWSSWNYFNGNVNESLIRQIGDVCRIRYAAVRHPCVSVTTLNAPDALLPAHQHRVSKENPRGD